MEQEWKKRRTRKRKILQLEQENAQLKEERTKLKEEQPSTQEEQPSTQQNGGAGFREIYAKRRCNRRHRTCVSQSERCHAFRIRIVIATMGNLLSQICRRSNCAKKSLN